MHAIEKEIVSISFRCHFVQFIKMVYWLPIYLNYNDGPYILVHFCNLFIKSSHTLYVSILNHISLPIPDS